MNMPYRTVFHGELIQDSALSVGGNQPHGLVDDPLCVDGLGRYTLRGESLGGALVATARKVYSSGRLDRIARLPGSSRGDKAGPESLWRVFNAHPCGPDPKPELRQGVGIRHDTGAAATGALFDMETLPRGTRWHFILEVTTSRPGGEQAEGIAAHVLREWHDGRAWIGRNVARGMGWLRLEKLTVHRLDTSHLERWPDSTEHPLNTLKNLAPSIQVFSGADLVSAIPPPSYDHDWYFAELTGSIRVGSRSDGYGVDAVSVGGHGGMALAVGWDETHFLRPAGVHGETMSADFDPDAHIVMTREPGGEARPLIPGSSLRGPLRHCLARHYRWKLGGGASQVRDPMDNSVRLPGTDPTASLLDDLVGDMKTSARWLVRDAVLEDEDWHVGWLQQHAEDEFAGGVYGSSKFDRMALLAGAFNWKMFLEGASEDEVRGRVAMLKRALHYGETGQVGLGGQQWRGLGWPSWTVDEPRINDYQAVDGGNDDAS